MKSKKPLRVIESRALADIHGGRPGTEFLQRIPQVEPEWWQERAAGIRAGRESTNVEVRDETFLGQDRYFNNWWRDNTTGEAVVTPYLHNVPTASPYDPQIEIHGPAVRMGPGYVPDLNEGPGSPEW